MQWQVGDVSITLVRQHMASVDAAGMFPGSNAEEIIAANADWLKPHFVDDNGMMPLSIHALVVTSMGKTIVVDTCLGNRPVAGFDAMSHLGDQFLHDFAAAGFGVDTVDYVVAVRHLHSRPMSGSTRCSSTASGSRRSPTRATCSVASSTSTGMRATWARRSRSAMR